MARAQKRKTEDGFDKLVEDVEKATEEAAGTGVTDGLDPRTIAEMQAGARTLEQYK